VKGPDQPTSGHDAAPAGAGDGGLDSLADLPRWLVDNWDPDLPLRAWWKRLAEGRWAVPTWSPDWFGRGLSLAEAVQVNQAILDHGAVPGPGSFGGGLVGPTLLVHGSDAQRARHLPRIATGELAWCQLFSEPQAGSDLAGLQTRALRDGSTWIVSGQKVWTSGGQIADWAMLLARTDVDVPKHAGISYFLIDIHQPGVEVRPLREMTGRSFFNEVFLTEARVSADDLVGGEGNGWAVANTTLAFERALAAAGGSQGLARPGPVAGDLDRRAGSFSVPGPGAGASAGSPPESGSRGPATIARRLISLANRFGRADDPAVRQQLALLYTLERVAALNAQRARATAQTGTGRDGTPNLAKMAHNRGLRVQRDLTFAILGASGTLFDYDGPPGTSADDDARPSPNAPPGHALVEEHDLVEAALFAQGPQIYGGSEQIQRNIVGERVLGLAKEPGPDRATPFRDLPRNS
jgi:alkylation response protein AidB-like acyl-CoA dehydrogenase